MVPRAYHHSDPWHASGTGSLDPGTGIQVSWKQSRLQWIGLKLATATPCRYYLGALLVGKEGQVVRRAPWQRGVGIRLSARCSRLQPESWLLQT